MRILFLGDVVGQTGCNAIKQNLQKIIKEESIDFTIVNGENAADEGVGITQNIIDEFLSSGVDVNFFSSFTMLLIFSINQGSIEDN